MRKIRKCKVYKERNGYDVENRLEDQSGLN